MPKSKEFVELMGGKVAARKTTGKLTSGKTVEKVTEMIEGKGALVRVVTVDRR